MKFLLLYIGIAMFVANNPLSAQTNFEIPVLKNVEKGVTLKRTGYTVSFNKKYNIPNWVAWKLNKERLVERVSRKG